MTVFKCKMCGGDLNIEAEVNVVECEYCGTTQTVPIADNEKKVNLFNRANRLRLNSEFDKAAGIYESIIAEFPEEAEAYWGLCLCNYGIEYVDAPATAKKVPTCHRASFEKLSNDDNFNMAMEYADVIAQKVYRDEAREIDRIMDNILSISKNEKPYDVFVCYKETDDKGTRTIDSVLAQDVYDALTAKGLKVFFARITLEDKLGQMYEPYIFAALNSAKVLLCIGTKYEHFHAVWVKNEWSRFLKLMAKDKSKVLIPCYKDMDAYDLPDEFKALQAQDMGKIGFMQDLLRGILKITGKTEKNDFLKNDATATGNVMPLLERVFLFLEDGEWKSADEYCEKVLDLDPKSAEAYLGKLMAELKVKKRSALGNLFKTFENTSNFQKAVRFGDDSLVRELNGYNQKINDRNEENRLSTLYNQAVSSMKESYSFHDYKNVARRFEVLRDLKYKDSEELYNQCISKSIELEEKSNEDAYNQALRVMKNASASSDFYNAKEMFMKLGNYKDANKLYEQCNNKYLEYAYTDAVNKMKSADKPDDYQKAITLFHPISSYKDSSEKIVECRRLREEALKKEKEEIQESNRRKLEEHNKSGVYKEAVAAMSNRTLDDYQNALAKFKSVEDYKDSKQKINECQIEISKILKDKSKKKSIKVITVIVIIGIIAAIVLSIITRPNKLYNRAQDALLSGNNIEAAMLFGKSNTYNDAIEQSKNLWNEIALREFVSAGGFHTVILTNDGTATSTEYKGKIYGEDDRDEGQFYVNDWSDLVAVSSGGYHTLGLKSDGTVVASGSISDGKCDVKDWKNIVAVYASHAHAIGIKADGSVVVTGYDFENHHSEVEKWNEIVAVTGGRNHTVGLKADGTVVAAGDNSESQCNVSGWYDIVAVSANSKFTVGLKSDGTVVATGNNSYGQCNIAGQSGVVAVSSGWNHSVALKSDGTVVSFGDNSFGQCDVGNWTDIVYVSAGYYHTVGVKSDGTIISTGKTDEGQCDVSELLNIKLN